MSRNPKFSRAPQTGSSKLRGEKSVLSVYKRKSWMNEHHRLPRSRGGDNSDNNVIYTGRLVHESYHVLFGVKMPTDVCSIVNLRFEDDKDYLISIAVKDFGTCLRYLVNSGILQSYDFHYYGVTWYHIHHYGNKDDLSDQFIKGPQALRKIDSDFNQDDCLKITINQRWSIVFPRQSLPVMAYQLTKYWIPLDTVILAIPKQAKEAADELFRLVLRPKHKK